MVEAMSSSYSFEPGDLDFDLGQIIPPQTLLPQPRPTVRTSSPRHHSSSHNSSLRRDFGGYTAPPQPDYQATLRDVEHALHSADTALRNAREAFRNSGMASHGNVVDLTNVSSDVSTDDSFMIQTRHPHDFNRGRSTIRAANSFNEPTLEGRSARPTPPSFRHVLEPNFNYQPLPPPFIRSTREEQENRRQDESAVRRQAQARRDWERVERRNRQRAEEQALRDAAERLQRDEGATDATRRRRQRSRSNSHSSHVSSASELSAYSLTSISTNPNPDPPAATETVDLTGVDDSATLDKLLAKEQQEAIANQNQASQTSSTGHDNPATALSSYKCAICMDSPTQATTTICGHLFCNRCIMDSLKWSEQLRRDDLGPGARRANGLCPVCRKPLQSKETTSSGRGLSGGIVSLEIKKLSRQQYKTNKERQEFFDSVEQKGKERAKTEDIAENSVLNVDSIGEKETESREQSLGRGPRRKRKRNDVGRSSVDLDSLFGSD